MAQPLQGLTGLYGSAEEPHGTTGRSASEWGGPADQRHAIPGDSSHARPYSGRVYGAEVDTSPEVASTPLPGMPTDRTPDVHSAPYPKGVAQDPVVAAQQMRQLHGVDLGGTIAPDRVATPYAEHLSQAFPGLYSNSPNSSALAAQVPAQLRSGSKDQDQGDGSENGYGFQFGHQLRRLFSDPIPLDRTGTVHAERPFYGHHPVDQHLLNNDSEYGQAGDISTGMGLRPTPVGAPTPWQQPPGVTYRPTTEYTDESGFAGDWMAG